MAFNTSKRTLVQFGAVLDIMVSIKRTVARAEAELRGGKYPADKLIALIQTLKARLDALESIKADLALDGGTPGSYAHGFNVVVTRVTELLDFVQTDFPIRDGFLLLYSMGPDFNLVPRVFKRAEVKALDAKLTAIAQEID